MVWEDVDHFGDVGSLDDNVESCLSHDGGDGRDLDGTLKQNLTEHKTESSKGNQLSYAVCCIVGPDSLCITSKLSTLQFRFFLR